MLSLLRVIIISVDLVCAIPFSSSQQNTGLISKSVQFIGNRKFEQALSETELLILYKKLKGQLILLTTRDTSLVVTHHGDDGRLCPSGGYWNRVLNFLQFAGVSQFPQRSLKLPVCNIPIKIYDCREYLDRRCCYRYRDNFRMADNH